MITRLEHFHIGCPMCDRRVLVTGCFDVLHLGHQRLIERAKSWGRELIIGLNSDESVRQLKPGRPIHTEMARAQFLMGLRWVNRVVIFDEPTCVRIIHAVKPMVWVKGGDYTMETLNQEEVAAAKCYGRVEIVPILKGYSTTSILEKLKQ